MAEKGWELWFFNFFSSLKKKCQRPEVDLTGRRDRTC